MALLVASPGVLSRNLSRRLKRGGTEVTRASPDEPLFERAMGHEVILYAPCPRLLDGTLEPEPDLERMRRVLGAGNAPGVRRIVMIVPCGDGYDKEIEALRRDGRAYIVLKSPILLEEVAEEMRDGESLWLPRTGSVKAAACRELVQHVLHATTTEYTGRITQVPGDECDLVELFERARDEARRRCDVHGVWEPLHRVVRPLARYVRAEPNALSLADKLRQLSEQPPRAA